MLVKCKFLLVLKSFNICILIMKVINGDEKLSLNCMGLKFRDFRVLC